MSESAASIEPHLLERLRRVRLLALDVDGILTDGRVWYAGEGDEAKSFHVQDGLGIQLLKNTGIEVAIITARASAALNRRVRELNIQHFMSNQSDKLSALRQLTDRLGISLSETGYVGDDLLDVPALRNVGFAATVADAHPVAARAAHWVASRRGGSGAVRQIADQILEAQGGLTPAYERHLSSIGGSTKSDSIPAFGVIVPARYGSSRLPGKPLLDVGGKPMVLRVVDNAKRTGAEFVLVATDDERIARVVENAGESAVMTSAEHASGTDRLAEVVRLRELSHDAVVVNVQGDEPLLDPDLVRRVAQALATRPTVGVATAATPIRNAEELTNPNVVKVTTDRDGLAIAFSRAAVPWVRDEFLPHQPIESLPKSTAFLRHIGLYAYRVGALLQVASQAPVALEKAESLEQLRAQWLGIRIHVTVVDEPPGHGVDTEADLAKVRAAFEGQAGGTGDSKR